MMMSWRLLTAFSFFLYKYVPAATTSNTFTQQYFFPSNVTILWAVEKTKVNCAFVSLIIYICHHLYK